MYCPAQKILLKWMAWVIDTCRCAGSLFTKDNLWLCITALRKHRVPLPSTVLCSLKNQTLQTCTITVILCKLILHGNYVRKQLHRSAGCHSETRLPPLHSRLHSIKFENTPSWACRWIPWTQDPSSPAGLETTLFTKTELIMFYFQWLLSRNCYHWLFGHAWKLYTLILTITLRHALLPRESRAPENTNSLLSFSRLHLKLKQFAGT